MKRLVPALLSLAATAAPLPAGAAPPPDGPALFGRTCAPCHAAGAPGALTLGRRLGPQSAILEQRTDLTAAYIRLVVRRGLRVMPWVTAIELRDRDLDAVATYLTRNNAAAAARP